MDNIYVGTLVVGGCAAIVALYIYFNNKTDDIDTNIRRNDRVDQQRKRQQLEETLKKNETLRMNLDNVIERSLRIARDNCTKNVTLSKKMLSIKRMCSNKLAQINKRIDDIVLELSELETTDIIAEVMYRILSKHLFNSIFINRL